MQWLILPLSPLCAQVTPPPGSKPGAAHHGLLRPLFVRLAALGHVPHLLRRQYRCHPDLVSPAFQSCNLSDVPAW